MIILSILSAWYSRASAAQEGSTAFNFLNIGAGSRAIGMGEAFTAVADDVTATYWNPAGLTRLDRLEASFMHARWFEDITYQYLAFARSLHRYGALGISLYRLSKDDIQGYDAGGMPTDKLEFSDTAASLTFGYPLMIGKLDSSVGITTKFIREKIAGVSASAVAFDLGVLSTLHLPNGMPVNVAGTIKNLGTGVSFSQQSYALPTTFTYGASVLILEDTLRLALDHAFPRNTDSRIGIGAEYHIGELLMVRAGYRSSIPADNDQPNNGFRYGMGLGNTDTQFDYAFVPYGDLGTTHRFSVTVRFGEGYRKDLFTRRLDAHFKKAQRHYTRKDLIAAYRELKSILAVDPAHHEALDLLARVKGHTGSINLERHLSRTEKLIRQGDLLEAQDSCMNILAIHPDNQQALLFKRRIDQQFEVKKKQKNKILFEHGEDFYKHGDFLDAIDVWEKLLIVDPENTAAREKITQARTQLMNTQRRHLERRFVEAKKLYRKERWEKTIEILDDILTVNPEYPQARGLADSARKELTVIQTARSEKYLQEGINYYRTQDFKNAKVSFQKALKAYPDNNQAGQYLSKVKAMLDALNDDRSE